MHSGDIDIEKAATLVADLERDLQKLSGSPADLRAVRAELGDLRNILHSTSPEDHSLRAALRAVRHALQRAVDTVEGEAIRDWPYIAEIGRILGMR